MNVHNIDGRFYSHRNREGAMEIAKMLAPDTVGRHKTNNPEHIILDAWQIENGRASIELLADYASIFLSVGMTKSHFDGFPAIRAISEKNLTDHDSGLRWLSIDRDFPFRHRLDHMVDLAMFEHITAPWGITKVISDDSEWEVGFSTASDLMAFTLSL